MDHYLAQAAQAGGFACTAPTRRISRLHAFPIAPDRWMPPPWPDAFAEITNDWDDAADGLLNAGCCRRILRLRRVVFKDESTGFGLGSFKALGGAYAVRRLVKQTIADGGQRR